MQFNCIVNAIKRFLCSSERCLSSHTHIKKRSNAWIEGGDESKYLINSNLYETDSPVGIDFLQTNFKFIIISNAYFYRIKFKESILALFNLFFVNRRVFFD